MSFSLCPTSLASRIDPTLLYAEPPNHITHAGYSRIILAGVALHFMSYHPKYCTLAYGISCLLDAADGHFARALGQTSKFGAVLDMVTDRCVHSHIRVLRALLTFTAAAPPHLFCVIYLQHTPSIL